MRILVISGPNAGGKSITLKTMGLLQLMFQSGILIPTHPKSKIFVFDQILTDIGVDYVEAGWPGANPTDDKLFKTIPEKFKSKVVAFGMMRKKGQSASNDPGLNAVLNSGVSATCLVGKSWDFHVKSALGVTNSENLDMIYDL